MTTQDTIELLYEAFRENPTRLTYSTKTLCKQFAAEETEVKQAKKLYRLNPNDFTVAQALDTDLVYDSIPASDLFDTLTGKKGFNPKENIKIKRGRHSRPYYNEEKLMTETLTDMNEEEHWEVKQKWVKGKEGSQLMVKKDNDKDLETLRQQILSDIKTYAPKYKASKKKVDKGNLLVISLGDIHLGKLSVKSETGEDYNVDIAINRVLNGVEGLIQKASGFNIDTVLLIIGNDILHTDTLDRKTTNKTPQDTDGMWHENFIKAKNLYVEVIERLMSLGNVYVQFNDSNHDRMGGFFLAQTIEAWFRNSDIVFDVNMRPRKYFQYGQNLIGTTHGESKESELPLLMAVECVEGWGETSKRYWYCHHIHHKKSKEYMGVCVEYLRSPSGTDAWHSRNGYLSNKALEAFVHDYEQGQVCRFTEYV